jgi:hypothetical protein
VVFSIRYPDMTVHGKSDRCPIEEPHRLEECGHVKYWGEEVPWCHNCGAVSSQKDINGEWWHPCACAVEHWRYGA